MKKLFRSRSVLVVGKLCLLMLVLSLLCPTAPSYAVLIESNGTGKYEITGNDTWGLIHPINGDEEVSSLTIIPGASLTLDVSHSNIYGNGNMIISGGGELIGQYGLDPSVTGGRGGGSVIFGLESIRDITLSTQDKGVLFSFSAIPNENDHWAEDTITLDRKSMTVENVRRSPQSDLLPRFYIGGFANKNVSIDGGLALSITNSDFANPSLVSLTNSSFNIKGDNEISISNSTVVTDSVELEVAPEGGTSVYTGSLLVSDPYSVGAGGVVLSSDLTYKASGQNRIFIKDVSVDGFLGVFGGIHTSSMSDIAKAVSEIESAYIEISDVKFEGSQAPALYVYGGNVASTCGNHIDSISNTPIFRQYHAGAEGKILGTSEIVVSGNGVFPGLANGVIYCGGIINGEGAVSTVGNAKLTLKNINSDSTYIFNGLISGQGLKEEYPDQDFNNMITSDYTDSVLGDSVLVLDNVKADMSSDKVTVKYFDEIQIANNTAVKLTALDADMKKLTVTGEWGAEVTALEFKQPVQNFASIAVDCSAASGVTDAYFTDDGMKFIVNGTDGGETPEEPTEPEQPSTDGGSGGGGGCNAGFSFGGLLAFAGLAVILRKNSGR